MHSRDMTTREAANIFLNVILTRDVIFWGGAGANTTRTGSLYSWHTHNIKWIKVSLASVKLTEKLNWIGAAQE